MYCQVTRIYELYYFANSQSLVLTMKREWERLVWWKSAKSFVVRRRIAIIIITRYTIVIKAITPYCSDITTVRRTRSSHRRRPNYVSIPIDAAANEPMSRDSTGLSRRVAVVHNSGAYDVCRPWRLALYVYSTHTTRRRVRPDTLTTGLDQFRGSRIGGAACSEEADEELRLSRKIPYAYSLGVFHWFFTWYNLKPSINSMSPKEN